MEISNDIFQYFTQFLEATLNFKHFEKNFDPRTLCLLEVRDCERHDYTNV